VTPEPHVEPEAPARPSGGNAAVSGALIVMSVPGMIHAGKDLAEGHYIKGAAGMTLNGTGAGAGGVGLVESLKPGLLPKGLVESSELIGIPLMVGMGIYDVATAPPGKREQAAARSALTGSSTLLVGSMIGGPAGFLAGMAVNMTVGAAFDKGVRFEDMKQAHEDAMKNLKEDDKNQGHLRSVADDLQHTVELSNFSTVLKKDGSGKVDITDAGNLAKIKEALPADERAALDKQADENQKAQENRIANSGLEGLALDKALRENTKEYNEKQLLSGIALDIQDKSELTAKIFEPGQQLALDGNGKIDLNNEQNRTLLGKAILVERKESEEYEAKVSQLPNFDFLKSEEKQKLEYMTSERIAVLNTAGAELNTMRYGTDKLHELNLPPKQQAEKDRKMEQLLHQNPGAEATFIYTIHRDANGRIIGAPMASDQTNPEIPKDVWRAYTENPEGYQKYKNGIVMVDENVRDANGNIQPQHRVLFVIRDPDLKMSKEPDVPPAQQDAHQQKMKKLAQSAGLPADQRFEHNEANLPQVPAAVIAVTNGPDSPGQARSA
jgi:hypothetical protein